MYFTVDNIYSDIVFWRRNLFMLPSGVAEKRFISALSREAHTIQDKVHTPRSNNLSEERLPKTFAKLVFQGKTKAAMKFLEQQNSKGIPPLSQSTMDEFIRKHPNAAEAENSVLISGPTPYVDPAMFQNITESTILSAALKTKGSSGPSGIDADGWRSSSQRTSQLLARI